MEKYVEERPWGKFEQFVKNEKCTVKLLFVKGNEELSLQYHYKRDEFWRVLKGKGIFIVGDEEIEGKEGDEFFVERGKKHRIKGLNDGVLVLEISLGDFDENDIVRLEDKYGRLK